MTPRDPATEPASVDELHLPPTFVVEHALRTLSYQGAMTATEMARHWRVQDGVATEIMQALKSGALIELDSGQVNFDRISRVKLSAAGQARVDSARQRTRYAGAIPVSLSDFASRADDAPGVTFELAILKESLSRFGFAPEASIEIAQALSAGATLALSGVAFDEEDVVADALRSALTGVITIPHALYAAGSIVRLFDSRYHRPTEAQSQGEGSLDVLRSSRDHVKQWVTAMPPAVILSGGVSAADVLPAYDDESKFYIAPPPFAASGGLLAILDAATHEGALADLARLWLIPGRRGTAVLQLRSGERIEAPWRAATALINVTPSMLPVTLRDAFLYAIDVATLDEGAIAPFLASRLPESIIATEAVTTFAATLADSGVRTRTQVALAAMYIRNRAAWEGSAFTITETVAARAVEFAQQRAPATAYMQELRKAS